MPRYLVALLIANLILSLGVTLFYMRTCRSHLFRLVALFYLAASTAASLFLYNQLLSQPKPISQEFFLRHAGEAVVLGAKAKDEETIYLWLQLPGHEAPAYYSMPWSGKAEEDLQMARKVVGEQGGSLLMKDPFQAMPMTGLRGDREDRVFYVAPPPRPPLKAAEETGADPATVYRP